MHARDPNVESLTTPFLEACARGHLKIVNLFLPHVDDINQTNRQNKTALYLSAQNNNDTQVVQLLLAQNGILVDAKDDAGNTPLMEACVRGHLDTAVLLLTHGANIDHQNRRLGNSALHRCVQGGNRRMVHFLVEANAQVNLFNNHGFTPSEMVEADNDRFGLLTLLAAYGSDVETLAREIESRRVAEK